MATKTINKSLSDLKRGVKLILKNNNELVYFIRMTKSRLDHLPPILIVAGPRGLKSISSEDVESYKV